MSSSEKKYGICERKSLPTKLAFRKFGVHVLLSLLFTLFNDQPVFRHIFQNTDVEGGLARRLDSFAIHDFKSESRAAKTKDLAGYLRRPSPKSAVQPEYDACSLACRTFFTQNFSELEPHLVSTETFLMDYQLISWILRTDAGRAKMLKESLYGTVV